MEFATRPLHLQFWLLSILLLARVTAQGLDPADPEAVRTNQTQWEATNLSSAVSANGMVASSCRYATRAGLAALQAGGNAFDAAAIVQFVLNVTEPYASGIGGGLFVVGLDAREGRVFTIDGREEAPVQFHPDIFLEEDIGEPIPFILRSTGGLSVGVPGTLAAMAHLLETRGTLTLAEALASAILRAETGFPVNEPFARNLSTHWLRLLPFPEAVRLFGNENGIPLEEGDFFRNPDLAATFQLIAEEGMGVLYHGFLAGEIVQTVREANMHPGVLSLEDMARYRPLEREPVAVPYREYTVYGMNLPSSGGPTLAMMLRFLETTDFLEHLPASAASLHRLADVQNLAFSDRNEYMADPDFVSVPLAGLLDPDYLHSRASLLQTSRALVVPVTPGQPTGAEEFLRERTSLGRESDSTTHFTVVDRDRNVVSVTSTIEAHFGSGLVVPGRGFLLNNQLTDFEGRGYTSEGRLVANAAEGGLRPRKTALGEGAGTLGGKRPRSSMSPTLVLRDGQPVLALGSPGGSRIIGITFQVLAHILDHGMDPQKAILTPRVVARNGPMELETALFTDTVLRQALAERGFQVEHAGQVGSVQAILIDPEGNLLGGADPRRDGLAEGY